MAAFFLWLGIVPLIKGHPVRLWAVVTALVFLLTTLLFASLLTPLNQLWFKLGLVLHTITGPIILGIMFYGIITPIGFIRRLSGHDRLGLNFDASLKSYWLERTPPGPTAESFKNQF